MLHQAVLMGEGEPMKTLDLVLALVDVLVVPGAAFVVFGFVINKTKREAQQRWDASQKGTAGAG